VRRGRPRASPATSFRTDCGCASSSETSTRSELLGERLPHARVAAADVTRDDDAVLVEDCDGRVPEEREGAGELGVGSAREGQVHPYFRMNAFASLRSSEMFRPTNSYSGWLSTKLA
jgi:hypothetical protein